MARPFKSQWEFGELFPPEQTRSVLSVAELTAKIRRVLEKDLAQIWVSGEITNLRLQASGHIYFSLKDATAQLGCVLFRGETGIDRSLLQDGREVLLRGDITVYEPRGQYQLRVTEVELRGQGALQVAFEKLKQKLKTEGLFDSDRKRPLPRYAQRIGLVTSRSGAAIHDVLHVVRRRNPALEIVLAPCRVQGAGAANEIAAAIQALNRFHQASLAAGSQALGLDLILLTRGGGSLEDLWAFNEEPVARAIFASSLPVVSAVGHEIDFTISDFVADFRAATPSAAAELITEGVFSSCQFLAQASDQLRELMQRQLDRRHQQLAQTQQRLTRVHPRRQVDEWLQRLDDLQDSMARCGRYGLRRHFQSWQHLTARLARLRPMLVLRQRREVVRLADDRLREQVRHRIAEMKNRVDSLAGRLRLLGPEQVLARGYSITLDAASGTVLRDAKTVKPGQRLRTHLATGQVESIVPPGSTPLE